MVTDGAGFVDLSVMSFVTSTLASTRRIVGRPSKQRLQPQIEDELASVALGYMSLEVSGHKHGNHQDGKKGECYEESRAEFAKCTSAVFPPRLGMK